MAVLLKEKKNCFMQTKRGRSLIKTACCAVLAGICLTGCARENSTAQPAESVQESEAESPATVSEAASGRQDAASTTEAADEAAQGRTYYLQAETAAEWIPRFTLFDDGRFHFSYDVLSSYYAVGTYTLEDGMLTAVTDDGLYHYVFRAAGSGYSFVQEESSEVSLIDEQNGVPIEDGAVFSSESTNPRKEMTAIVKEIGDDFLLVSSGTDEYPGAFYVYFGGLDISGIEGGDEITIFWDGSVLETSPAQIYADGLELK